jgi:predicted dehydrogenase
MGNVHANQYRKMPDVELHFFDVSPEASKAFAQKWEARPASSLDDLISKSDLVDVCLPTDHHLDAGMKAIAAGRALFMEKPMARTLDEATQLVHSAEMAKVPLMPGQVVRFFPEFARAKQVVAEGGVGKPAAARTRRGGGTPKGADGWFMDHERSGGVLFDLAIHDFDWLRWTLGEVKFLYSRSLGAKTGTGPDYALTTLTFDDGAVAHVEATWMDPAGFRVTFEVCGSGGMIEYDSRLTPTLRANLAPSDAPPPRPEAPLSPTDDPYYKQLRAFVDSVNKGTPPPVSAHDGWMAMSIALAAVESAKTGKCVAPRR